jgi:hypothetical protein
MSSKRMSFAVWITAALTFPSLARTASQSGGVGNHLFGARSEDLYGKNPFKRKASFQIVLKGSWIGSEINEKREPSAVAMVLDQKGKCHIVGFRTGTTCKMKVLPDAIDFTVRWACGRMDQHWRLDNGAKTFTQDVRDDGESSGTFSWMRLNTGPESQWSAN